MKKKNRIRDTLFVIFLGIILVTIFKYFHFLRQPDFVQENYDSFLSYPGVGGILSNLTIIVVISLLFNFWKKSKEEKLIEVGKKNEVENIKNLFSEGILTEKEVNSKFDFLLKKHQKEIYKDKKEIDSLKKNELIEKLSILKEKGILTEYEYEKKKEQVLSDKKTEI